MAPTEEGNPDLPREELATVHAFTGVMIKKLIKGRHKGGWKGDSPFALYDRMDEEGDELYAALMTLDRLRRSGASPEQIREQAEEVAREAADIANFAMFIADVVGGL